MPNVADTTDALIAWCDMRGTASGVDEFLQIMKEQNTQHLLPHVLGELQYRQAEARQNKELRVSTALSVTDEELSSLQSAFGVSEESTATTNTEPSLLGGVSCKHEGQQVADTFRSRLEKLQVRLQS